MIFLFFFLVHNLLSFLEPIYFIFLSYSFANIWCIFITKKKKDEKDRKKENSPFLIFFSLVSFIYQGKENIKD